MLTDIKLCHVTEKTLYCVFLRNIHSDVRFIGTPPKEVLYLDLGIAKKTKKNSLRMRIENATVSLCRQKKMLRCFMEAKQIIHRWNVMSLAKMIFSCLHHLFFDELKLN